jgi:tetratricopeptide (TPR) repeat protein
MTLVVGNPFETQDAAAALLVRTGHPAEAAPFLEELVRALPWNPDFRVRLAQARLAARQNTDAAAKDLIALGSSSDAPYETRLAAARALGGGNGGTGLGSKELDLIAGGRTITASDANQPFFLAARLKAAEVLPADGRIKLLRALLEDNPRGDAARVPLLKAAIETGDYHLAINAMNPYLQTGAMETALDREQNQNEEDPQIETEGGSVPEAGAFQKLPAKERAEISRDLGLAFEKTNALDQALAYLRRAYRTETDPATKSQTNKEVQQIRAVLRRRATNLARQPLVHTELEQDRAVRPRVPEPAAPNPVKPRSAGGKGASA